MEAARWLAFFGGTTMIVVAMMSLIHTLIVPRGVRSGLTKLAEGITGRIFTFIADRFTTYSRKDAILAHQGPVSLLAVLVTWLGMLFVGFALMLLRASELSFPETLSQAGSAMFTLGFSPPSAAPATYVHFAAAAIGLIVIALQIAYLPVLYQAFNRRETLVTTLESRAGAPAWGPEIIARHYSVGIMDSLPSFYSDWERWSAEVAESHTTYPVLIWFRSPNELRHWVVGLLAVLDAAALHNALAPGSAPSEARLCLRMGFITLREIATVVGIPFNADPLPTDPIRLTYENYVEGVKRIADTGFPMERSPEEAWPHFHGWRVNYESLAYALADRLLAVPGPWTGPREHAPATYIAPITPVDRRPNDPDGAKGGPAGWR